MKKNAKADRKKMLVRIVCMSLAVIMIGSVILAAALSQVY